MPPAALKRATAHSVALSPLMPGLAAMPARGARMPSLQGLFCAMAGAPSRDAAARALVAVIDLRRARRVVFIDPPRFRDAAQHHPEHDISVVHEQQRAAGYPRARRGRLAAPAHGPSGVPA